MHHLLEDAARDADAVRHADEHERDVDGDLLAGDELLEVDVQDLLLERVALDLADQRARDVRRRRVSSMTVLSAETALEQLLELARR